MSDYEKNVGAKWPLKAALSQISARLKSANMSNEDKGEVIAEVLAQLGYTDTEMDEAEIDEVFG